MFFAFLYNFAPCLFLALAGMEVAAALTDKAHSVSVVGNESVPFKKALGEKVGKAIMKVGMCCGKKMSFQRSLICFYECKILHHSGIFSTHFVFAAV